MGSHQAIEHRDARLLVESLKAARTCIATRGMRGSRRISTSMWNNARCQRFAALVASGARAS